MERITYRQSCGSGNIGCGNVTNGNNNITVKKTDDQDNQIKQCLSPLCPNYQRRGVQPGGEGGVGGWFLEMNEFRQWSTRHRAYRHGILHSNLNICQFGTLINGAQFIHLNYETTSHKSQEIKSFLSC